MPRIPTLVPSGYGDVCEKNQQKFGVFFDLYYLCKRIQYLNSLQGSKNEIYTLLYMPLIDDV